MEPLSQHPLYCRINTPHPQETHVSPIIGGQATMWAMAQVAAVLALGAHGAVLGTRLAATKESMYSQEKKVLPPTSYEAFQTFLLVLSTVIMPMCSSCLSSRYECACLCKVGCAPYSA